MVGIPPAKAFELPPAGPTPLRCYGVLDLGSQETEFEGRKGMTHQIVFLFELPLEITKDNKLFMQKSREFSLTWGSKSKLAQFMKSWMPTETFDDKFDFGSCIGRVGMGNIVHNQNKDKTKTYSAIDSIMPLPKGMGLPSLPEGTVTFNDSVYISLDDQFDAIQFEHLPEYWKDKIAKSPEYKAVASGKAEKVSKVGELDDQIPF